nr:MAG TPA: hypothetical protein [Caudoviricetes sp.]
MQVKHFPASRASFSTALTSCTVNMHHSFFRFRISSKLPSTNFWSP